MSNKNASSIEVRINRHLYDMLLEGDVIRHAVKNRDVSILGSPVYEAVDIIYDQEGRYVPHFYVCKTCSLVMVVHQEGGNSKLRTHQCVKHHLKDGADEDGNYFLEKHFLNYRERKVLKQAFSRVLSVGPDVIAKTLPLDWEMGSWNEFVDDILSIGRNNGSDKSAKQKKSDKTTDRSASKTNVETSARPNVDSRAGPSTSMTEKEATATSTEKRKKASRGIAREQGEEASSSKSSKKSVDKKPTLQVSASQKEKERKRKEKTTRGISRHDFWAAKRFKA